MERGELRQRKTFKLITYNLKIIQHSILNSKTNKHTLVTNYITHNLDVISLNSHGLTSHDELKVPGYIIYRRKL